MLIEPFEFIMKDGRRATVRCAAEDDIGGLLEYLRVSAGETEFIMRYPEECGRYTEEGERAYIESVNSSERAVMPIAVVDGRLVGTCEVRWSSGIKTRHRAMAAIAILKDCWGQGLGTRLMTELITIAEANPDISQIELDFVEGNARAQALYEKLGFRITGVIPNAIRLKNGRLLNEIHMIREVKR